MKISILGAGNMGGSIARGLAKNSNKDIEIVVTAKSEETLANLKNDIPTLTILRDNAEACKGADLIILAVKPWILPIVIDEIKESIDFNNQMIASVVAGISFEEIKQMLTLTESYVDPVMFRIIPNTAISIGESMTLIASYNADKNKESLISSLFDSMGKSVIIEERLMGAGTALCSCGIAYAFKYVKASVDGAVEMGFYPQKAKEMVCQTLLGAVELLMKNDSMPDEEIYKVTTPGGITIKGLNEMEANGFSTSVIKGLKASVK